MATNTLNTRVVICSKTTAQWNSTTTVPLKGEICIEWVSENSNTLPKMKVGDGTNTYPNLPYATFTENEIKAFISQAAFDLTPATASALGGVIIGDNINVTSNGTISVADASANTDGLMSSTHYSKLEGIASGAEVNQNAFSTVKVGTTSLAADSKTDTLTITAGDNITLTPTASSDSFVIAATDTTYSDATTAASGLMSASDKTKLNGVATGAEVNQNAFSNVKVGSTTVAADAKTDTLELVAGDNVTLTPDATNDKITITATDTTYNDATTTTHGLMSTADKTKLNSIEDNADYTQIPIVTDKTTATESTTTIDDATNALGFKFNNATIGIWEEVTRNTRTVNVRNITIDDATTSQKGIVQLNSATNSTSTTTAATPSAVKSAYDKANAAMPKSGGTFTGAVTLNADPTANLGAATKQYVDNQISTAVGASDAMVFKGTLGTGGTITAVPTTGVVKGDTYKVITAGTWAGSTCKVGDLLIALNSGDVAADTTNWAYVPSGDEATTSIKYSTTTQNLTTSAKTGAITVGEAATKQVDTSITAGSTSTKLPTSAAVASFVEGKGYITSSGTAASAGQLSSSHNFSITGGATAAAVSYNGTQNVALNVTAVSTTALYTPTGDTLIIDGNFT